MSPSNRDGRQETQEQEKREQEKREQAKRENDAPATEPQKTSGDRATMPAAGPHAKPELTNDMSTPGAGALPDADDDGAGAQDSTTG